MLFADDNADVRQYVGWLLAPGYDVQLAADGETALAAALDDPPDLIVTDGSMPLLDGFGLVRALRSDPRTATIPVILLTPRHVTRLDGLSAGADDVLIKPFSATDLRERIASHAARARAQRIERKQREEALRASEERKLAEQALAEARLELSRVMRVMTMGQLAASIAHEVNQPLAAVITNGHACARWLGATPPNLLEANLALGRIIADANRASEVLASIRRFLKRDPTSPMAVDVQDVMAEVIAMVQAEIRAHQVSVHSTVAPGVPAVAADRVQLQQVLLNLVLNAIEAMSVGTDAQRVLRLQAETYGPHDVLVGVEDSGVGLKPGDGDRIFDAFFTTKKDGMGMGLTISRSIIEAHGGRLWATPNPVQGATFQFVLPAAHAQAMRGMASG